MKKILFLFVFIFSLMGATTIQSKAEPSQQNQCRPDSPCFYSGPVLVEWSNGNTSKGLVDIDVKEDIRGRKIAIVTRSQAGGVNVGYTSYIYKGSYKVGNTTYNYAFECGGVTMYFNGRF